MMLRGLVGTFHINRCFRYCSNNCEGESGEGCKLKEHDGCGEPVGVAWLTSDHDLYENSRFETSIKPGMRIISAPGLLTFRGFAYLLEDTA